MNIYVRKEQLLMSIDEKRKQMVEVAQVEGYTGETTIKYSQELDNLMNEYQHLLFHEKQSAPSFHDLVSQMSLLSVNRPSY
ncbi:MULTISPECIES: aspartyl-phosphate phosphatase Spo0E family protein [Bacillus]|uniref:aspartyl-phosphate phosphatase Spo0E family protein n=1 Tax=Bacillus TaxID=1386 RepID=UPI000D01E605|nr:MULTISPECIES: aspartyl-phosphate phosphatase Spo0E family protein [Bacillus]MDR0124482.1 aspartyl-phosphate phosphatase Spo0E family protein [Bacillus zhangzhouensis]PRO40925.1 aspartyl-phosphate phosphatase Spo0E family protein [Bacillus sp. LLTC93]